MKIAVFANVEQWKELRNAACDAEWLELKDLNKIPIIAEAIFILKDFEAFDFSTTSKPIFIHSVTLTLVDLNAGKNVFRLNGWPGFLSRQNWEIAGSSTANVADVFLAINKKFTFVPDEPGLIAARIIAMIINEAWFALGEALSSKKEIDIAMKLGTNYPLGPFEWGEKIGEKNIYTLLQKLNETNKRYQPAPLLLEKTINELTIKY